MTHFIITGTGRCGTGYVSEALKAHGLKTGHERVFTPDGFAGWGHLEGDSSWLAAPHISDHDGPVIHLVREPRACIASIVASGLVSGSGPFTNFAKRWCPDAFECKSPVDRAQFFYLDWNAGIEQFVSEVWRIEDLDVPLLAAHLGGREQRGNYPPTDYNHTSGDRPEVTLWPETEAMAARYGY